MIRWRFVQRVLARELRDTLRDRTTLLILFGMPLLVWPMALVAEFAVLQKAKTAGKAPSTQRGQGGGDVAGKPRWRLGWVGEAAVPLRQTIEDSGKWELVGLAPESGSGLPEVVEKHDALIQASQWPSKMEPLRRQLDEFLQAKDLDVLLVAGVNDIAGSEFKNSWVLLFNDSTRSESKRALSEIEKEVSRISSKERRARLESRGLAIDVIRPVVTESYSAADPLWALRQVISCVLPGLISILLLVGCAHTAIEATAGEKESGTLVTLLASPVKPLELIVGKWVNTWAVAVAGFVIHAGSFALLFGAGCLAVGRPLSARLDWAEIAWIGGMISLLAVIWAALLAAGAMAFSSLCSTYKVANAGMGYVILLGSAPAFLAGIPEVGWQGVWLWVPSLSLALDIKSLVLTGTLSKGVVVSVISTGLWTGLALVVGAQAFAVRKIKWGTAGGIGEVLTLRRDALKHTGAASGWLVVALLFLVIGYGQVLIARWGIVPAVVVLQVMGILGVPLFFTWYFRLGWAPTMAWRWPGGGDIFRGILLGLTAWILVLPFVILWPPDEDTVLAQVRLVDAIRQAAGTSGALLLVAVLPAICEELAFRGFVLQRFRLSMSTPAAVAASSAAFAAAHLSVERFVPLLVLGALCGTVVVRSGSIVPGMLVHGISNAIVVLAILWGRA